MTDRTEREGLALKPCPFCGGTNIRWKWVEAFSCDSSYPVFGCMSCNVTFEADSEDGQTEWDHERWNRRAPGETKGGGDGR
ncbi:hypothetical protein GCM10019059_44790 [Camelimonas fluminis]|uniref:Lar family restriction alleviation protein n=1 Tax=Camelimonas fluminis TaxID=1576911 RepID=A0ABV7UBZ2_9HYPH|nr:Lar family restriction alleviation protein [Camelimonas fluminis]GHE82186.1 hypothetical protein GCM10019059_44790 [Camelimonas fluminis]